MASTPAPHPIFLEPAGYDELDAVMAVMDGAFPPDFGEGWSRSQVAGILPLQGIRLVVAHEGRDAPIVGFALWRTISDESELLLLAVHPEMQGHGLGHALLDEFVTCAMHDGARRLHLEVRDGNPATKIYAGAGFSIAGRRRDYYRGSDGERFDALTYVKNCE